MTAPAYARPILDLIGRHESRGDYNIVYSGIPKSQRPARLTTMTVQDVRNWQDQVVRNGAKSSAAGKYQIIRKTMDGLIKQMALPTNRYFNETTQDDMAMQLLTTRGFLRYLSGQNSIETMMVELSKEWASFPVPTRMKGASRVVDAGRSYYAGDGLNAASATVADVRNALLECSRLYKLQTGPAPKPSTVMPKPVVDSPLTSHYTDVNGSTTVIIVCAAAAVAALLYLIL